MQLVSVIEDHMTSRETTSISIHMIEETDTGLVLSIRIVPKNFISGFGMDIIAALTPIFVIKHYFLL
jgi:hypothetical protein